MYRQEPSLARTTKTRGGRVTEKIATLKEEMRRLGKLEARMLATPDQQISLSDRRCPLDGDKWPRQPHGGL